jgi:short-subunit dehydrogenase
MFYILACFGFLSISVLLYQFYFIQGPALNSYRREKESWAVVTGASAGIGFALSKEIAKYGFNVVLIGHKEGELKDAAYGIQHSSPNAKTEVIVLDATTASFRDIDRQLTLSNVRDRNVSVLINNVGGLGDVFKEHFKPFHAYTPDELDSVLAINNRFMVYLTSLMIPVLSRDGKRSLIINIGSMAENGTPYQVLYSGTKGFINSFSKALDWELKAEGYNIDVVDVSPGEVRTQGHRAELSWRRPTTEVFAEAVLRRIGPGRGRHVIPYAAHRLLLFILELLPESVQQRATVEDMWKMREKFDGKKGS